MNFQEKLFETSADLRTRAAALATVAVSTARSRARIATTRVEALKGAFGALTVAGRELNKVTRRHAVRFVKENSTIAAEASRDISALARTTYATLARRAAGPQKARKTTTSRKRASRKAA